MNKPNRIMKGSGHILQDLHSSSIILERCHPTPPTKDDVRMPSREIISSPNQQCSICRGSRNLGSVTSTELDTLLQVLITPSPSLSKKPVPLFIWRCQYCSSTLEKLSKLKIMVEDMSISLRSVIYQLSAVAKPSCKKPLASDSKEDPDSTPPSPQSTVIASPTNEEDEVFYIVDSLMPENTNQDPWVKIEDDEYNPLILDTQAEVIVIGEDGVQYLYEVEVVPDKNDPISKPRLKCVLCEATFLNITNLNIHIGKKHTPIPHNNKSDNEDGDSSSDTELPTKKKIVHRRKIKRSLAKNLKSEIITQAMATGVPKRKSGIRAEKRLKKIALFTQSDNDNDDKDESSTDSKFTDTESDRVSSCDASSDDTSDVEIIDSDAASDSPDEDCMVVKKKSVKVAAPTRNDVNCNLCGLEFSTILNYKTHLHKSKLHKKKIGEIVKNMCPANNIIP